MVFVLGGLLLALVSQYGIAPRIAAKQGAVWQYAAIALYALQWLCALGTLWKVALLACAVRAAPSDVDEDEAVAS